MISAEKLKLMRNQLGWSQEQLAQISGISCRTIQRIEKTGDCSLESKMALAAAFAIAPEQLNDTGEDTVEVSANNAISNLLSWVLLLIFLSSILLLQGEGEIKARLHINAVILAVTFLALSVRAQGVKRFTSSLAFSLGFPVKNMSARQAVIDLKQQITFVYAAALFAFLFHTSHLLQLRDAADTGSGYFLGLVWQSAISSLLYAIFIAELVLRNGKMKAELALLVSAVPQKAATNPQN